MFWWSAAISRTCGNSRTIIRNTLITGTLIALVLGIGGGLLTSRNFLRRVDAITDASRSIMRGDLSGRMPVQGTGDELDRLASSLNQMLDQIERLMRGMQEVSSNVAHDLRTPLTRIKARAESALRSGAEGDFKAALEQTIDESDRLLQTFTALLSIAKAESGQSREGLQPVDAAVILNEVAELYEPFAEDQGGSLKTDISGELNVRANRQLLAQAISNLVDNALKYGESPASGFSGNPRHRRHRGRRCGDHRQRPRPRCRARGPPACAGALRQAR